MAYIAPNSTVWLYKGVPLDPNYENTYWFPDKATQKAEFDKSYLTYTFTAQSYCRATGNSIRIQRNPDDLINCNYMAFRNTSFGNKIFYAFIDEVAYINNSTAEVRFTIDVLQTYFRDVIFMPSYIEREHSATDEIGDNIVPEPVISSGQEVISNYKSFDKDMTGGLYTVIVTSHDILNPVKEDFIFQTAARGGLAGACIAGAYNVCDVVPSSLQSFYNVMNNYIRTCGENGILGMYCIPKIAYTGSGWDSTHRWIAPNVGLSDIPSVYPQTLDKPTPGDSINGYIPKNNKLYTYPYCYARVTNGIGSSNDYRYEFFTSDSAVFRVSTSGVTPDQSMSCAPNNYRGFGVDWESSLTYNMYPASSFITEEYNNYIGTNANRLLAGQLSRIAGAFMTAAGAFENPMGAITGLAGNALQGYNEYAMLQDLHRSTSVIGGLASGYLNLYNSQNFFKGYRVTVNASVARQYDNYFTRYGYAVKEVKFPNFIQGKGRQTFNYIKTNGASIVAKDAPADAIQKMKQIFDSGTTVWLQLGNVGNFGLSNNPIK